MKILFLDQYSESGGAQLCLGDVMRAAAQRGWEAELWAPGDGFLHATARSCGFKTRSLQLRSYLNGRKSAADCVRYAVDAARCRSQLAGAARRMPPAVVYVNGPRALPAVAAVNLPAVFHSHSVLDKWYSRWIARWSLAGRNFRILASSEFLAGPLRRLFGPSTVRLLYNGVPDCGDNGMLEDRGPDALCVGIVGRIAPEKGQLHFLETVRILVAQGSPFRFAIVGEALFSADGYAERVQQEGQALGVRLTGWLNPMEIFRQLDVLAVPSAAHDANPRVILEAMSAGTCVVAYRSGGISELITNGYDGLTTEPNPGALAGAIRALAGSAGLRRRLRANARRTYERRFTVLRFQREVCEAIASLAGVQARAAIESRYASVESRPTRDKPPVSQ